MTNPIIQRELVGMLRTRKALAMQVLPALVFALLVILRWPTDARVGLSGVQAQDVFRVFGYGLLATLLLFVPVFPATTLVREKMRGTLALLLGSPMHPASIYIGKFLGVGIFVFLPLVMSIPAAAACYAMGGISFWGDVAVLYAVLGLVVVQYTALGLFVSSGASSTDGALRVTYGVALLMSVVSLGPYQFLQGKQWPLVPELADWIRCLSPVPAVMEILGHGDAGAQGLVGVSGTPGRYVILALLTTAYFMLHTALTAAADDVRPLPLAGHHHRRPGHRRPIDPADGLPGRPATAQEGDSLVPQPGDGQGVPLSPLRPLALDDPPGGRLRAGIAGPDSRGHGRHVRLGRGDDRRDNGRVAGGVGGAVDTQLGGRPD